MSPALRSWDSWWDPPKASLPQSVRKDFRFDHSGGIYRSHCIPRPILWPAVEMLHVWGLPNSTDCWRIWGCPLGGRKPYLFSGFLPSLSKIAAVVGDLARELDRMMQTRNGVVSLPHKYLEGKVMQSYPARALDRRLQVDWARDPREGLRVLMSLRVDFERMG